VGGKGGYASPERGSEGREPKERYIYETAPLVTEQLFGTDKEREQMSETQAERALRDAGMLPADDPEEQYASVDQLLLGRPPAAKFASPGDMFSGKVLTVGTQQTRKYGTNEPEWWPDGRPKLEMVLTVKDSEGTKTLYCSRGMQDAIRVAVQDVNFRRPPGQGIPGVRPGGYLTIKYTGDDKPRTPGGRGAKLYEAGYDPPGVKPIPDAPDIPVQPALADDRPPF
jgi:hypothetical protein